MGVFMSAPHAGSAEPRLLFPFIAHLPKILAVH